MEAPMPDRLTLKRHAGLVDRMATTLGVDLEEATMRGRLPVEELSDVVLSCTGCTDPTACEHWLDDHEGGVAEHAPGYCRNRDRLEGLRAGT
jgi:hypothetical protein